MRLCLQGFIHPYKTWHSGENCYSSQNGQFCWSWWTDSCDAC